MWRPARGVRGVCQLASASSGTCGSRSSPSSRCVSSCSARASRFYQRAWLAALGSARPTRSSSYGAVPVLTGHLVKVLRFLVMLRSAPACSRCPDGSRYDLPTGRGSSRSARRLAGPAPVTEAFRLEPARRRAIRVHRARRGIATTGGGSIAPARMIAGSRRHCAGLYMIPGARRADRHCRHRPLAARSRTMLRH